MYAATLLSSCCCALLCHSSSYCSLQQGLEADHPYLAKEHWVPTTVVRSLPPPRSIRLYTRPMRDLYPRRRPHFGIYLASSLSSILPVACLLCAVAGVVSGALKKMRRVARDRKSSGEYVFKHRWPLWLFQISAAVLSTSLVMSTQDLYSIHLCVPCSLLIALFCDGSKVFRSTSYHYPWLVLYGLIFLSCIHTACLEQATWLTYLNCVLSGITVYSWYLRSKYKVFHEKHSNQPSSEYTSNILSYVFFSYLNSNIFPIALERGVLEAPDVPFLSDFDSTDYLWRRYQRCRRSDFSLLWNLFLVVRREWCIQGLFAFFGAMGEFIAPIALGGVLWHISHDSGAEERPALIPLDMPIAVILVGAGPFFAAFFDNINYAHGRHVGIQIRALLQCCIYDKLLRLDPGGIEDGAGRVNNLVSNDCTNCLQFWSYSHGIWTGILQIGVCVALLYATLGMAAFGGLAVMLVAMPFGAFISDR